MTGTGGRSENVPEAAELARLRVQAYAPGGELTASDAARLAALEDATRRVTVTAPHASRSPDRIAGVRLRGVVLAGAAVVAAGALVGVLGMRALVSWMSPAPVAALSRIAVGDAATRLIEDAMLGVPHVVGTAQYEPYGGYRPVVTHSSSGAVCLTLVRAVLPSGGTAFRGGGGCVAGDGAAVAWADAFTGMRDGEEVPLLRFELVGERVEVTLGRPGEPAEPSG